MKNIKNQIRRLNAVLKDVGVDAYAIGITDNEVTIQADFKNQTVRRCKELKYDVSVENCGYIYIKKHNVRIVLT